MIDKTTRNVSGTTKKIKETTQRVNETTKSIDKTTRKIDKGVQNIIVRWFSDSHLGDRTESTTRKPQTSSFLQS